MAKVIGTVIATRKAESLKGAKLMIVQPLNHSSRPTGRPLVAVDTVDAGKEETVFVVTGREASLALPIHFSPVDAAIVGVVDSVNF